MNVSGNSGGAGSSSSPSSVRESNREVNRPDRRDNAQPPAQARVDFESALRSKQQSRGDEQDDDEHDETPAEGVSALAAALPPPPPLPLHAHQEEAPVAAARSCDLPPSGTQAKMEAALNANVAAAITEVGANDPAAMWEASLRDPNAVPLDVRVLRGERIGGEANAALTVSVRSSSVSADVLGRHASKLDERLKKRGVDGMHVRIEDGLEHE